LTDRLNPRPRRPDRKSGFLIHLGQWAHDHLHCAQPTPPLRRDRSNQRGNRLQKNDISPATTRLPRRFAGVCSRTLRRPAEYLDADGTSNIRLWSYTRSPFRVPAHTKRAQKSTQRSTSRKQSTQLPIASIEPPSKNEMNRNLRRTTWAAPATAKPGKSTLTSLLESEHEMHRIWNLSTSEPHGISRSTAHRLQGLVTTSATDQFHPHQPCVGVEHATTRRREAVPPQEACENMWGVIGRRGARVPTTRRLMDSTSQTERFTLPESLTPPS
jgi:hypothetical protein